MKTATAAVLVLLSLFCVTRVSPAEEKAAVPQEKGGILLISKSTITQQTAGNKLKRNLAIDAKLKDTIAVDLLAHGLKVTVAASDSDQQKNNSLYVLAYKLEKVESGLPAKVSVSYSIQKGSGEPVASGQIEETAGGWKSCVKKIGDHMANSVAAALGGKPVVSSDPPKTETPAGTAGPETDGKSVEVRLKQLDGLKAKGLVTEEEYKKKRDEILKDL
jgi:hypothetical protein